VAGAEAPAIGISRARQRAAQEAEAVGAAVGADTSLPLEPQIHQDIGPGAAEGAVDTALLHPR
jgi:hypothetical protein